MLDDRDILNIYKEEGREEYAFNLIVRKYSERLYWHIRQIVLDHDQTNDLLQNTSVKVWRSLPDFREESKLFTWLYRIATNETLSYLKRERMKNIFSIERDSSVVHNLESDPYFNGDDLKITLYKAIQPLPSKQRTVFVMRYFEEMKYEDILDVLGGTEGSLKASYHHAYQKVKKFIEDKI